MDLIGTYSLMMALLLSGYAAVTGGLGGRWQRQEMVDSSVNACIAVFVLLSIATAALLHALITRDFQVAYVWRHTSRNLSLTYTIAAFYAGQEGSLLFWAWILSGFTMVVVLQNRRKHQNLLPYVLAVLMGTVGFFSALIALVADPFELLNYVPRDGRGLNPMLQNPGMLFHPPTLFLGYVGFTVPFAFCLAALVTGRLGDTWVRTTRRWTIISWFFLTVGNLLGMEWAYVELGWGGYWAWDPVENASFMPWLVGTAYLHSVMIQEKRDMLKVWNIVLIMFTFLLTIFGTFITRSGIIASVHSFGQSSLGWIFLGFLVLVLLLSMGLLLYRLPQLRSNNRLDSLLSRESSFLYNNLLLMGVAFAVFWGTIFPIISEAVRGVKITVGPPFFNSVITPIALGLLLLTGLCPLIGWRRASLGRLGRKVLLPGLGSLGVVAFLYAAGVRYPYALASFGLCAFVIATIVYEFSSGIGARRKLRGESPPRALWNLVARNKRRYGGYIVHAGVVLIFVGITGGAFNSETQRTLSKGESFNFKQYQLRYEGLAQYATRSKETIVASITVLNEGRRIGSLTPEKSLYHGQEQPTTEVAIHSNLMEDLYIILAGFDNDSVTLKVLVNPLVAWLWIGGLVMTLGTFVVMLPQKRKQLRAPEVP